MPVPPLLSNARAFVFDAYGTLFDVHSATARHKLALGPDASRLSEIWRLKQLEYSWILSLAGRYEPFWTLTERALDYAFACCPTVDRALRPALLDAYQTLDAYPNAPAVLARLREAGLRTAILSNGSPEMLRTAVASAGVDGLLDQVLSVDAVKIFKASPRTYELVLTAFEISAQEVVFVSSNRWDIAGAAAFGFRPVWVNRSGLPDEYPGLAPVLAVRDLAALA